MSWIDEVLKATEYVETPRSFIKWSALCAMSAVVAPNIFIDRHHSKLSPNIYVMLLAKSGLGKGFPIYLAKTMVEEVNCTRTIAGRNSIQAVLKELGTMRTGQNGGPMLKDSRGFLVSGEFADFITYDPQALIILTDLYDTQWHKDYKNTMKGAGIDILRKPCLTMFGASAPVHFKNIIPDSSLGGGFIARTLLVYEDKRSRLNSFVTKPEYTSSPEQLSEYLKQAAKVSGEFVWSSDGAAFFDRWYGTFRSRDNNDETGTYERLGEHAIKVAMLVQLCHDCESLILRKESIEEGIQLVEDLQQKSKLNMMVEGKSVSKEHISLIIKTLLDKKNFRMARIDILQKAWGHMNANELDLALGTLFQMQYINEMTRGNNIWYQLTPKAIKFYEDSYVKAMSYEEAE